MPTDKNLGPSIMNRDTYIEPVLKEHLMTPSYCQLSPRTADHQLNQTKCSIHTEIV
jgi:hypothetical protein